jgi:hypothetical protein
VEKLYLSPISTFRHDQEIIRMFGLHCVYAMIGNRVEGWS